MRFERVGLCVLLIVISIFAPAVRRASAETGSRQSASLAEKKILVIHSHEANAPVFLQTDKGLSEVFASAGIPLLNQTFESLELRRNPGPEYRKLLVEQMRIQYGGRKPDMIVSVYPEALEFVLKDCKDIFPGVPVIALHMPQGLRMPVSGRPVISHSPVIDIAGTVEIALRLAPSTRRVYVVSGAHAVDRRIEDQARKDLPDQRGIQFLYLSDLPFEDMVTTIAYAPADSVVLLLAVSQDVTGRRLTALEVAERLGKVSKAPVFGVLEVSLGHGIAGGRLISFEHIGRRAGQLALEVLRGAKAPGSITEVLDVPAIPMFDWRQLRHWHLNENKLPEKSIVINKQVTLWDLRYYLIGALVFCLAEAALIVVLTIQRRRKRMAEISLKQAEESYRDIFENALEGIYKTSPEGQSLTANPALARMLGYASPEEVTSTVRDSAQQVWVDPGEREEYVRLLEGQGLVRGYECRYKRKDGTKLWVSLSTRRVPGPDGRTLFYTGFIEDITERKRAQEALEKSEAKYRQLHETLMDGYVFVDMDGAITEYNESYLRITGYSPEELLRLTYRDLTPQKWHDFEQKIVEEQVLVRGYSEIYEKEYRRKDGTVLPVELRTALFRDATGANNGMWATVRDISERKRAEEALIEAERKNRELIRFAPTGIYEIDAQTQRFVSVNDVVCGMLGYSREELLQMNPSDILDEESRVRFRQRAAMILSGKEELKTPIEYRVKTKGGNTLDVVLNTAPRINSSGRPVSVTVIAHDITERKRSEEALRQSEERFRQVAENVGDFIWEVDINGLYRYTSPSVERILGYRPDELIGKKHFYDFFVSESGDVLKASALRAFASQESFHAFPNANLSKDGRVVYLETSGSPVLDRSGNLIGYRGADTDVTERIRSEEILKDRLRFEQLLSGLSARFVNIPLERVDSEIDRGLIGVLEFFRVDRVLLLRALPGKLSWEIAHVAATGNGPAVPRGVELQMAPFPWSYDKLFRKREVLSFSSLDDLPAGAGLDRQSYIEWGVRSSLSIPVIIGGPVDHVIVMQSMNGERVWSEQDVQRLRLAGDIVVNALERKQIRLQIAERLRFEALAADLSARLVNLSLDQVDAAIDQGLRSIAEFFEADRCTIRVFSEDQTRLVRAFEYRATAAEPAAETLGRDQLPWYLGQLILGNTVVINRVEDLPREAEKERRFCQASGMKSLLSIPMVSGGKTLGSCALLAISGERVWPDSAVQRLRAIAEVFTNALQRKRAESMLRTSEEKFRHFFSHTPEYCYILSPDGTILDVNNQALVALGYERDEIVGRPVATIYAPESLGRMRELFFEFSERGEIENEEALIVTKDGERRTVFLSVGTVRDADGTAVYCLAVQTDITERKRAELETFNTRKEMLRLERLLRMGELSASLAHELNQPLTSILSNARAAIRLLEAGRLDMGELKEILQDIAHDDKRAGDVVRSLRAMVKVEEGDLETLPTAELLREAITLFNSEAIMRNIRVEIEMAKTLPSVKVNKVQVQQVIINLMMNAVEAMEGEALPDRRLIIRAYQSGKTVCVAVRDFGKGIAAPETSKLFEPFFTTKDSGLGMGLSLSRSVMEAHGGHIWAENNPDKGATFCVDLPIAGELQALEK